MKKLFHNFSVWDLQAASASKFIEIMIYCSYLICFWIYLSAYAERMWDFMKEGQITQWVFLFLYRQNLYASFGGREKREKKSRTFMFSRNALTYQSGFTEPHKYLEGRSEIFFSHWRALNGIAVKYCFSHTQESDVHSNWLRDVASAREVRLHASPPLWEAFYSGT